MSNRERNATTDQPKQAFRTTPWTDILDVRSHDESRRNVALGDLLGRYWKPVYCYLRCKGYERETAKDLTQGFLHEIVLTRGLIQRADRAKGRFRTFLLKALREYVVSVHRAETAKQRMPEGGLIRLEGIGELTVPELIHCTSPREAFDYAWASALLDQVLTEVAGECRETGIGIHWDVFQARVVRPIMDNAKPSPLAGLCAKYCISSEAKASNMVVTVKRRFHAILRRHVRQLVQSDEEVHEEIRDLMRIFSKGGAGS